MIQDCTKGWRRRCSDSRGLQCTCRCAGRNHGRAVQLNIYDFVRHPEESARAYSSQEVVKMRIATNTGAIQWYTLRQFAKIVCLKKFGGVNRRYVMAFRNFLKSRPDFVEKYCQNISLAKRPKYLILWRGLEEFDALTPERVYGEFHI